MRRTAKLSFYVIIFLIFAMIGYWMPMVGDDLNWWSNWGKQYFQSGTFTYYDGRYLGDLLIISMMKFKFIAFLAYGTFPTLIVFLIQKIREEISPTKTLGLVSAGISAFFLLMAPKLIFKQIWGWHSGFANYVPSVVFPLFLLYLVIKNLDNQKIHYYRTSTMLIFFAAFFAQFFAEHITLLNCFNIVLVWLLFRKRFGNSFNKVIYSIMGGNFLGAILMFINGAYIKILAGTDAYRHVNGSHQDTLFNYFQNYYSLKVILTIVAILFIAAIVTIVISIKLQNKKQAITNISLILSGIVAIIPFIIISPFGSRCIFASFTFGVTLVAINLDIVLEKYHKFVLPIVTLALIGAGIRDDYMAKDYGETLEIAIDYAAFQTNANSSVYYIPSYKNTDYIWSSDTHNDAMFKSYYIENKNIPIVAISYADWRDALNTVNKKSYQAPYFRMEAFDKQIKEKVKLINAKVSN
ncbi:DUF6056 family protein [Companilactobacillus jidongensis]|uniref:DUF6056 family protein n=1 Tax=Companilactobacillus jidongensis TaxID=2486006 RepID=UPI0013DE51CC|nr:DUF6056 family protein [Companilactobacillus jidongensis]